MHDPMSNLKLGQSQAYVEHYDPGLLQPIPRDLSRRHLPRKQFLGADIWTAYELSWLAPDGKPLVAIGEFIIPCDSANLIESKSFKYYLNSFNQTQVASKGELREILVRDLSLVAGVSVSVQLFDLQEFTLRRQESTPASVLLDVYPLEGAAVAPDPGLLRVADERFDGVWCSHLLKSNCPVTGQPDWASIWIGWRGKALQSESLLRYLVSYRQHQDFHENCVERIYTDLEFVGRPESMWVYARYTRRGGLDINPFRSSCQREVPIWLAPRQ
ncbi:MAG: NADPH-dependent 7-cyano-7-deazaguanine reductase QueF [Cellvibrionaceae bacterium]|nr:NADPH-dependent 7-cyano-7-deazaguanine reductase QueF [Cellvibrionaceae bacterium]